jgi:hypothetical protein
MATFPRREAEIVALVKSLIAGMRRQPELYANSPVSADELEAQLAQFQTDHTGAIEGDALATQRHIAKDKSQKGMTNVAKKVIGYAEVINRDTPENLLSLGWAPVRSPSRPGSSSVAPGQVKNLVVREQGINSVLLQWKAPADGGGVAAYNILRRPRQGDNDWEHAGSCTTTEVLLTEQPRGIELMYYVVAFNKAGTGPDSNTVTLVL